MAAPALTGRANALKCQTVMAEWASCGNIVASVGQRAPCGSGIISYTISAFIVGCTTRRNTNASSLLRAPSVSVVANTISAIIVVARAFGWDGSASVGCRTPSVTHNESDAVSATVIG